MENGYMQEFKACDKCVNIEEKEMWRNSVIRTSNVNATNCMVQSWQ